MPVLLAPPLIHGTDHFRRYGHRAPGFNRDVLMAVDTVQSRATDGGGYFIGIKADPPESPVGWDLALLGRPLLKAPRTTSYCSGSSYAALVEALNLRLKGRAIDPGRLEKMRMQEPDGGRREDGIKAWGWWNADGPGCHYAAVQYLGIGERIALKDARPGDFANVGWKNGPGHSVVFLDQGPWGMRMWSSQKGTNGYGDLVAPWSTIAGVVVVRVTRPERLLTFVPGPVEKKVVYDRPLQK